jgi:Domain of unknown function (DUF4288)
MSDLAWYSAKLRFVVMVEAIGGDLMSEDVYLMRAKDFANAFERALSIGRAAEREYRNSSGQRVSWQLKEILSLDVVSNQDLDGAEICAEGFHLDLAGRIPVGTTFKPEASKPRQTI